MADEFDLVTSPCSQSSGFQVSTREEENARWRAFSAIVFTGYLRMKGQIVKKKLRFQTKTASCRRRAYLQVDFRYPTCIKIITDLP